MESELLPPIENITPTFQVRPVPIAGEFRPRWKMAVILIVMALCGRGQLKKVDKEKVRILVWALRSGHNRIALAAYFNGDHDPGEPLLRYEPSFVRACNLLMGCEIIRQSNDGFIELTDGGVMASESILKKAELFEVEKEFILSVKNLLTNEVLSRIQKGVL